MPFNGVLKQTVAFMVEVDASACAGSTAVTFVKVNKKDKITTTDIQTVAAGQVQQFNDTAAKNIDRLITLINPPAGGQVTVRVVQTTPMSLDTYSGDVQIVFDCAP